MRSTFKVLFYVKKGSGKPNGNQPLMCRITMDGQGNISLPSDIGATAMIERKICELFEVIAPTVRAGIKALCKSGVLKEYGIKRLIRLSERSYIEVYDLETIAALAFLVESFGAAKVRRALLERIIHGRKKKYRPRS